MLANRAKTSQRKGVDGLAPLLERALTYRSFSAFLWMASWTTRSSPQLAVGSFLRLTILLQVVLAGLSLWCVRCTRVSNKGGLLVSRISNRGDIFFGFSCRDAHHITGGCFSLASGLSTRDSYLLLAFDNVRMDPYCLFLRSRNIDTSFLSGCEDQYWSL